MASPPDSFSGNTPLEAIARDPCRYGRVYTRRHGLINAAHTYAKTGAAILAQHKAYAVQIFDQKRRRVARLPFPYVDFGRAASG